MLDKRLALFDSTDVSSKYINAFGIHILRKQVKLYHKIKCVLTSLKTEHQLRNFFSAEIIVIFHIST